MSILDHLADCDADERHCIVPVDGKDGAPFGIAAIWENWKEPSSGEWIRTFAIITIYANELVVALLGDFHRTNGVLNEQWRRTKVEDQNLFQDHHCTICAKSSKELALLLAW